MMTTGGKQSSPRTSVAVPRPTRPVRRSDSAPAFYALQASFGSRAQATVWVVVVWTAESNAWYPSFFVQTTRTVKSNALRSLHGGNWLWALGVARNRRTQYCARCHELKQKFLRVESSLLGCSCVEDV